MKKITFTYEIKPYSDGYEVTCLDWSLCTTCCKKKSEAKKYAILNTELMLGNRLVSKEFADHFPKKILLRTPTKDQFQLSFDLEKAKYINEEL